MLFPDCIRDLDRELVGIRRLEPAGRLDGRDWATATGTMGLKRLDSLESSTASPRITPVDWTGAVWRKR